MTVIRESTGSTLRNHTSGRIKNNINLILALIENEIEK